MFPVQLLYDGAEAERREGYGFQWWRGPHDSYSANGLFGQNCLVFPNERAVVAVTAGMDDEDSRLKQMIQEDLRPALGQWRGAELTPRIAGLDLVPAPPGNLGAAPEGWQGLYLVQENDQRVTGIRLAQDGLTLRLGIEDARGRHDLRAGSAGRDPPPERRWPASARPRSPAPSSAASASGSPCRRSRA